MLAQPHTIPRPNLVTKEYRTLSQIKGPLIFVERIAGVAYNELVEIISPEGEMRLGQVLEVDRRAMTGQSVQEAHHAFDDLDGGLGCFLCHGNDLLILCRSILYVEIARYNPISRFRGREVRLTTGIASNTLFLL